MLAQAVGFSSQKALAHPAHLGNPQRVVYSEPNRALRAYGTPGGQRLRLGGLLERDAPGGQRGAGVSCSLGSQLGTSGCFGLEGIWTGSCNSWFCPSYLCLFLCYCLSFFSSSIFCFSFFGGKHAKKNQPNHRFGSKPLRGKRRIE